MTVICGQSLPWISAQVWSSCLRLLHLKCDGDVSDLVNNLCLPILRDFKFTGYVIGLPSWPAEFTQMIRQSGCSIERISIQNIFTEPEIFMEMLHFMPELRELELIQEADWTYHTVPSLPEGTRTIISHGQR